MGILVLHINSFIQNNFRCEISQNVFLNFIRVKLVVMRAFSRVLRKSEIFCYSSKFKENKVINKFQKLIIVNDKICMRKF